MAETWSAWSQQAPQIERPSVQAWRKGCNRVITTSQSQAIKSSSLCKSTVKTMVKWARCRAHESLIGAGHTSPSPTHAWIIKQVIAPNRHCNLNLKSPEMSRPRSECLLLKRIQRSLCLQKFNSQNSLQLCWILRTQARQKWGTPPLARPARTLEKSKIRRRILDRAWAAWLWAVAFQACLTIWLSDYLRIPLLRKVKRLSSHWRPKSRRHLSLKSPWISSRKLLMRMI